VSASGVALAALIALISPAVSPHAIVPAAWAMPTGDWPSKNDVANSIQRRTDPTEANSLIRGMRDLPTRTSDENVLLTARTFLV
jgi:hypothetical protein